MEKEKITTAMFFLRIWLEETNFRCNELLKYASIDYSKAHGGSQRRLFEEHYLLTATVMSIRFARQIVHSMKKNFKVSLEHYIAETEKAKIVRDMREHSDEYFVGKGNKPEFFKMGSSDGIEIDMTSSLVTLEAYMLGNYVSVQEIQFECNSLLKSLNSLQEED
jgi:hypothetical protein